MYLLQLIKHSTKNSIYNDDTMMALYDWVSGFMNSLVNYRCICFLFSFKQPFENWTCKIINKYDKCLWDSYEI